MLSTDPLQGRRVLREQIVNVEYGAGHGVVVREHGISTRRTTLAMTLIAKLIVASSHRENVAFLRMLRYDLTKGQQLVHDLGHERHQVARAESGLKMLLHVFQSWPSIETRSRSPVRGRRK